MSANLTIQSSACSGSSSAVPFINSGSGSSCSCGTNDGSGSGAAFCSLCSQAAQLPMPGPTGPGFGPMDYTGGQVIWSGLHPPTCTAPAD